MTIEQELAYLDTLEKWRGGSHSGLEYVSRVASVLHNPQDSFKSIHITGTNGKGSTAAFMHSILHSNSSRVGLFTSPHISKINERIMIDGKPVSDSILAKGISQVRIAMQDTKENLSFFEAFTLTAFCVFANEKVDYAVIEVGLGGTRDATNIIAKPEVAIITTIGLDHQHILGETKELIAADKSGIIKQGVSVVIGDIEDLPRKVIEQRAKSLSSNFYRLGYEYGIEYRDKLSCIYESPGLRIEFKSPLKGKHQDSNAALAIKASEILNIPKDSIMKGISNTFWPIRLEWISGYPRAILLDAAHNEAAMDTLTSYLAEEGVKKVDILFGAVINKNWKVLIDKLLPYVRKWSLAEPQFATPIPTSQIAEYLSSIEVSSKDYKLDYDKAVNELIINHKETAKEKTPLLVVGSIYMVSGIRGKIVAKELTTIKI